MGTYGVIVQKKLLLAYSSIAILAVSITVLSINNTIKQNFKDDNPKLSNQTNVNLVNSVNNTISITGIVKHRIAECAPTPLQSKTCVFYNLFVLETEDNKTYSLYNLASYNDLVNKQIKIDGFLTIPSKTKLPFITADLNVTDYSVINNPTNNTKSGSD